MKQNMLINILIVVVASMLLLILWFRGLDLFYAQTLKLGANIALLFSSDTSVAVKVVEGTPAFIVETVVGGRKGSYPQKANLILLPVIMILTWQILLFFNLPFRQAFRTAWQNILIFYIIQVIYVVLLSSYYNSSTVKYIYDLLMDSFYIIALFLIVKDAFRYDLFRRAKGSHANLHQKTD
ncbi:MAG: hypothetical protein K0B08_08560 [Bacteroidales bacterium]|nr:hypothetical protein [Bacteroidales bacterium]